MYISSEKPGKRWDISGTRRKALHEAVEYSGMNGSRTRLRIASPICARIRFNIYGCKNEEHPLAVFQTKAEFGEWRADARCRISRRVPHFAGNRPGSKISEGEILVRVHACASAHRSQKIEYGLSSASDIRT